jgi:hypothetical protein
MLLEFGERLNSPGLIRIHELRSLVNALFRHPNIGLRGNFQDSHLFFEEQLARDIRSQSSGEILAGREDWAVSQD